MISVQRPLWIIALVTIPFFITGCEQDVKVCNGYTELTDRNHLLDITVLNNAPELLDTLAKYPQLQVYKIINDQYTIGMHCNVFYKELKILNGHYALFKSISNNSLFSMDTIPDTINISLNPSIQFVDAIRIARQNMDYSNTCIFYRLGIYDINAGVSFQQPNFKLAWKIQGENAEPVEYPIVVLDANTGQVYYKDDGIRF